MEYIGGDGMVLERINDCQIVAVSIKHIIGETDQDDIGNIGYIDFIIPKNLSHGISRTRFAFIALKDWESLTLKPVIPEALMKRGKKPNPIKMEMKKVITSQVDALKLHLEKALMGDKKVNLVVERRLDSNSETQRHDYLVKVDDIVAAFIAE
jgi:hypothetical protein